MCDAPERHNWKGDLSYVPCVVAQAHSVDDIVRIVKDRERYPSPVRAAGSQHSTTLCIEANGGTIVDVTKLDRILAIDDQALTITMQPGVRYVDAARALEKVGLAFHSNVEIGNSTVGSLACCSTKESSFPGAYSQASSYLIAARMVLPSGEIREVDEREPELLRVVRSSFGLLGILCEVTFRVRKLQALEVCHVSYSLHAFADHLPRLIAEAQQTDRSFMMYQFPHIDRVVVEYLRYADGPIRSHWQWRLRNWLWRTVAPGFGRLVTDNVPTRWLRDRLYNTFERLCVAALTVAIRGKATSPPDQIVRYAETAGYAAMTFSIWTFPEHEFSETIRAYFQFCKDYYRQHGFRCDMPNGGYLVAKDTRSLFSYSSKEAMLTIDPATNGIAGWNAFLVAYNAFAIARHGRPLINLTTWLTHDQARIAFGEEMAVFQKFRRQFDPTDRLYSGFFRALFG
ncbi:MAG TPA: FAD-binding oxidoreductase [Kofleriaceae bacterium]